MLQLNPSICCWPGHQSTEDSLKLVIHKSSIIFVWKCYINKIHTKFTVLWLSAYYQDVAVTHQGKDRSEQAMDRETNNCIAHDYTLLPTRIESLVGFAWWGRGLRFRDSSPWTSCLHGYCRLRSLHRTAILSSRRQEELENPVHIGKWRLFASRS